jgi:hypothetical protein
VRENDFGRYAPEYECCRPLLLAFALSNVIDFPHLPIRNVYSRKWLPSSMIEFGLAAQIHVEVVNVTRGINSETIVGKIGFCF